MPFLGCLWNRMKRSLEGPLALNARRATNRSLLAAYLLALLLVITTWVLLLAPWMAPALSPISTAGMAAGLLLDGR